MPNSNFVEKNKFTAFFDDLIKNEFKRRNSQSFREVFSTCNITQCDRRIIFRARSEPSVLSVEQDLADKLAALSQVAVKDKWLNFFSTCLKASLHDKNIVRADANYNLYGVLDGLLKINDLLVVLMVKAVSHEDFEKISTKGAPRKHVVEQMVNMWLAEIPHGIILYDDQTTHEYCLYHVTPYVQLLEFVCEKCKKLKMFKLKGAIPPRPYKTPYAKECLNCEFKERCWRDK